MFQKGSGKTKASHQPKAEMEANKKKNAKKENIWTADKINFLSVAKVGFPVLSLFKTISFQSIKD